MICRSFTCADDQDPARVERYNEDVGGGGGVDVVELGSLLNNFFGLSVAVVVASFAIVARTFS